MKSDHSEVLIVSARKSKARCPLHYAGSSDEFGFGRRRISDHKGQILLEFRSPAPSLLKRNLLPLEPNYACILLLCMKRLTGYKGHLFTHLEMVGLLT